MTDSSIPAGMATRMRAMLDMGPLSEVPGFSERSGRKVTDPWSAALIPALVAVDAQDLEPLVRGIVSLQNRDGSFASRHHTGADPTPWTTLFLSIARRSGEDSQLLDIINETLNGASRFLWENAPRYSLPELLASLAALAELGDLRGVERISRMLERSWDEPSYIVPYLYQGTWLLGIALARSPLPDWLVERYACMLAVVRRLVRGQVSVVPVPRWDLPFAAGALRWVGYHDTRDDVVLAALDRAYSDLPSLPDRAFAMAMGAVASSPDHGEGDGLVLPDGVDCLEVLGIRECESGGYRAWIFSSTGAVAMISPEGQGVVLDTGITVLDSEGRIHSTFLRTPRTRVVATETLTLETVMDVLSPSVLPSPVGHVVRTGSRILTAAVPILGQGYRTVSELARRFRKGIVHRREVRCSDQGVALVERLTVPGSVECTRVVLGASHTDRDLFPWSAGDRTRERRMLSDEELSMLEKNGSFEIRILLS